MVNKKRKKSLYFSFVVGFIAIFFVVIISFATYFIINNKEFINKYQDNLTEIELLETESERKEVFIGVQSAVIFALAIGCTLIFVGAMNVIKPITKLKEATKKVALGDLSAKVDIKRKDEIGDLANNFNIMVDELNSIEYLRKDFISNVSHEFKTPVASIQGFAKLLLDDNISKEEKNEYLNIILEETDRLSKLSTNMIMLSQVEHQEIVKNKREFRLDEQVRRAIIMLEEKISKKNIKITLEAKECTIIENQDLTMEIWINLLSNAIKYTNENGEIDINIADENEYIKVKIKDNGIGIEKEKQERIFEKFYQAENSHSKEGNGLGLAIVKRIVELLNGKIEFESQKNIGTTFCIYLKKNNMLEEV